MPPALISRSLNMADLPANPPGNILYVDGANGFDGNDGLGWANAKKTVQAAITAASPFDRVVIAPGNYDESVTITTRELTLVGAGSRGGVGISPSASNATGLTINGVSGTIFYNIDANGTGTGGGLNVVATAAKVRRLTAVECKFENDDGTGFSAKLESTVNHDVADSVFQACEFAWAAKGLIINVTGGGNPVTETLVKDSLFHDLDTSHIEEQGTFTVGIWLWNCYFARDEAGTAPTQYLLLNTAGTIGSVSGCRFAHATNASAVLKIAAGVLWMANATEAGWSTARPA